MKTIIICLLLLSLQTFCLFGQQEKDKMDKVFEAETITWCGLDFSNFRLTNPVKLSHGPIIKEKYFNEYYYFRYKEFKKNNR